MRQSGGMNGALILTQAHGGLRSAGCGVRPVMEKRGWQICGSGSL